MKKINLLIIILLIVIVALAVAIYRRHQNEHQSAIDNLQPAEVQQPVRQQIVHYPVAEEEKAALTGAQNEAQPADEKLQEKLPELHQSDALVEQELAATVTNPELLQLVLKDSFIQRFVASVDKFPESKLARNNLPIKIPEGRFLVTGSEPELYIAADNQKRYKSYLNLLEAFNSELLIRFYVSFYPLFQSAYEELGYRNAYFNDRLIFVIDHLLATPNPADPLKLEQPLIVYTYADPQLENLSYGQKMLLRIGQQQRTRVLGILAEYRTKLTRLNP